MERYSFMTYSEGAFLFDRVPGPVCITGTAYELIYSNDYFTELFAVAKSGKEKKKLLDILSMTPEDLKDLENTVFVEAAEYSSEDIPVTLPSGRKLILNILVLPLHEGVTLKGFMFFFRDITAEQNIQDKYMEMYKKEKHDRERLNVLLQHLQHKKNEIERLNIHLNNMVRERTLELEKSRNSLQTAYESMNQELETARAIQQGIIPDKIPEIGGMRMNSLYIPTGKVGGDLYDIFRINEYCTGFIIYDVSGHGVPAAFISAMAKITFRNHMRSEKSLVDVLRKVNSEICDNIHTEHYLTAFIAVFDRMRNELRYSKAGHCKPIILRKKENRTERLDTDGFFVGMFKDVHFEQKTVSMNAGDRLFLFTDGLYEIFNPEMELYGQERLEDSIKQNASKAVKDTADALIEDQKKFLSGRPRDDDVTLLVAEITDPPVLEILKTECGMNNCSDVRVEIIHSGDSLEKKISPVLYLLDRFKYSNKDIRQLKTVYFELLLNAVEHGNKKEPDKSAFMIYTINSEKVTLAILDEGEGFNSKEVLKHPRYGEALAAGGTGILLSERFLDKMEYNKKGNRVLTEKLRSGFRE
ncbi:MAG: SpoIIE family protein phosphatase [Fibrobacterota bacterium]